MKNYKLLFALSSLLIVLMTTSCAATNDLTNKKPPQAAIATAHPMATAAGMAVLNQGGNAFDAGVGGSGYCIDILTDIKLWLMVVKKLPALHIVTCIWNGSHCQQVRETAVKCEHEGGYQCGSEWL